MSRRWSKLHAACKEHARRRTGIRVKMLANVPEMQSRGVLHLHPVFPYGPPVERRWVHAYVDAQRVLAHHYGFGFNDRRFPTMAAIPAARYVSKYLRPSDMPTKASVSAWLGSGWARSIRIYVSPDLTRVTCCTMRALRRRRWAYVLKREGLLRETPDGLCWIATGEFFEGLPRPIRGP